ncbi:MAG TPA: DUF4178 domain-containing protein [Micavibrio sp.]
MKDLLAASSGAQPTSETIVKGKPKTFSCPSCGGSITIKAAGHTITAICAHCSSVVDVANENYQIIVKANKKIRETTLPIGAKGSLFGVEWEIVGYIEKTDGSGFYPWEEYLLYNPYHGFRFLVQADGHWNFVKVLKKNITGADARSRISVGDRKFQIFLKGEAVVQYVKGEFYWRVEKGDRARAADYISPPYILSIEKSDEEITAAWGEYIEPAEVVHAFSIRTRMPWRKGVAPNQPSRYQGKVAKIWMIAAAAIGLGFLLQLTTIAVSRNEQVYAGRFDVESADKDKTLSTGSFVLPKQGNVLIQSYSPVDNDWVELGLSLVNEQGNVSYNITQAIEYYYGYSSDGRWSEGGQGKNTYLSAIPPGNYRMLIDVDAGAFAKGMPVTVALMIKRDAPSWANFLAVFLLVSAYPAYVAWRRSSFETARWADSEYTLAGGLRGNN